MKIYLAAAFKSRDEQRPNRDALWLLGHEVMSTWLDEVSKPDGMSQFDFDRKLAMKDLAEINAADLLILDTRYASGGGKDTEFGFALGRFQNKSVWVVGPQKSVFHALADKRFDTWEECIRFLRPLDEPMSPLVLHDDGTPF